MSTPSSGISRTSTQLYRDCLRLIDHMAGKSIKGSKLRDIVRNEFKKNSHITDQDKVTSLKSNAIRGLSNYLMLESASKDIKFRNKVNDFVQGETDSMKTNPIDSIKSK